MTNTLASFFDAPDDAPALTVVDRSTLENYAVCPQRGVLLESGTVLNESNATASGNEGHGVYSKTITEYIDSGGALSPKDLSEIAKQHARGSRPDVQPDTIRAVRSSLWEWSNYIGGQHPENILRYDGGEGDRTGQLARDIDSMKLRVTSEVDLLCSTPAPEVLEEIDYKTGWKQYTEGDVKDSFQFGLHACLVFHAYPEIECLRVRVWNSRINRLTFAVPFYRTREMELWARVKCAAQDYVAWSTGCVDTVPCWPSVQKCPTCPAAVACNASLHCGDIAENPTEYVNRMVAIKAKLDAMTDIAKAYCDEHGDITGSHGARFGRNKPKADRKPNAQLYEVK